MVCSLFLYLKIMTLYIESRKNSMIWKKKTFYLNKILLYILRYDRNQNMSEESQKEIQSTVSFSRTRLRKTHHPQERI